MGANINLVCAAVLLPACGIGFGQQVQSASVSHYSGPSNIAGDPGYEGDDSFSIRSNRITLYDKSGILLASATNVASEYSAREQAKQRAIDSGARAGDSYSYSYNVYAPVPGALTTLSYAWGDGTGATNTKADASKSPTHYSEFDLTAGIHTWYFGATASSDLSLGLSANFQHWTVSNIPGALGAVDVSRAAAPIALAYGAYVMPRVHVAARVAYDPISLLGSVYRTDYTGAAHVSVAVAPWIHLEGDTSYARYPLDFGKREGTQLQAIVNVVFWWEPEFWKATHK